MYDLIRVEAILRFVDTAKGRRLPIKAGYKPMFKFDEGLTYISGKIERIEEGVLQVGETAVATILFIGGMIDEKFFNSGQEFWFGEGITFFGHGEILQRVQNKGAE